MGKKVTVENLASEVQKILDDYGDEVSENLDKIVREVGKKGVQALKSESLSKFPSSKKHKKRYGETWKSEVTKKRLYTTVTIYNSQPGLPHLLEHGHAKVNGGRVPGKVHIAPIENKLILQFEKEVTTEL